MFLSWKAHSTLMQLSIIIKLRLQLAVDSVLYYNRLAVLVGT